MQENWQHMLCLPTGVWHCPHLHENTYSMTCKSNKRLPNKKDYSIYATSVLFLPPGSHRSDGGNGPREVCNPTSLPEQDCLQHQIRSAGALTTQRLITAVDGGVATSLGGLCQVCAALLVHFFFLIIVQSEPHKPQYVAIAPTCHYHEDFWPCRYRNSPSNSLGRGLTVGGDTSFPFLLVLYS